MVVTVAATSEVIFGESRAQTGRIQQVDHDRRDISEIDLIYTKQ